jgi:succinate-acetate transporter protein
MQSSQPMASPLGILLMIVSIYLVFKSPKKLQTLGRMVVGFVVTALLFIIPGAILRIGDPQALGKVGGLVALLVAVIVGWWHRRSLRGAGKEPSSTPSN